MAPKKDGKKGDKKDKGGGASEEMTEKELLEQARLRIESLEQQLVWREERTQQALAAQRELQERVAHYHADFEREKEEIFDISADMTRQYKGMQEELIAQVQGRAASKGPKADGPLCVCACVCVRARARVRVRVRVWLRRHASNHVPLLPVGTIVLRARRLAMPSGE